jgi:hypothetical protein
MMMTMMTMMEMRKKTAENAEKLVAQQGNQYASLLVRISGEIQRSSRTISPVVAQAGRTSTG